MTFRTAVLLLAGSAQVAIAQGVPAHYVASLPRPGDVISGVKVSDPLDRYAQQAAALKLFSNLILAVANNRPLVPGGSSLNITEEERTANSAFMNAFGDVNDSAYAIVDPTDTENQPGTRRDAWNKKRDAYGRDERFRNAVLDRHLSPALRDQLLAAAAARRAANLAFMEGLRKDSIRFEAARRAREAEARRQDGIAQVLANPYQPPVPRAAKVIGYAGGSVVILILALGFMIPASSRRAEEVQFSSTTGIVRGFRQRSETHVSSSGGGSRPDGTVTPVKISSYTVVKTSFSLAASGRESPVQFSGPDIPIHDGQKVSVLWATHPRREGSPYMRLVNHEAGMHYQLTEAKKVATRLRLVPATGVVVLIGVAILFVSAIPTSVIIRLMGQVPDPVFIATTLSGSFTAWAAAIAYWVFARRRAKKTAARLDARADDVANAVGRGESISEAAFQSSLDTATRTPA